MAQGFFDDPATMALLGMSAGFGSASGPSRMPVPLGLAVGGGARGMMDAGKQVLDARQSEAATAGANAQAQAQILPLNVQRSFMGMSPLGDNGLPQRGGEAPQVPQDLSKLPIYAWKMFGFTPSEAAVTAAMAYGQDSPQFKAIMKNDALQKTGMQMRTERTYMAGADPDHPEEGIKVKSTIASPVPGTSADPEHPERLLAPDATSLNAVRQGHAAAAGGQAEGEATMKPAPGQVGPGGEEYIPTKPDGSPQSLRDYLYPQHSEGQAPGLVSGASPFARLVALGEGSGKNPLSSATGIGQFIKGTWVPLMQKQYPQLFGQAAAAPLSPQQIMAFRQVPSFAIPAIDAYAQQNAGELTKAGLPVNWENLLLAHKFGPGGATGLLKADGKTMAGDVLGANAIMSNPELRLDKTPVSQIIAQAKSAVGPLYDQAPGKGGAAGGGTPPGQVPQPQASPVASGGPMSAQAAAAPAGSAPAPGSMEEALGQESKIFQMPPNTIKPPANLADARKRANEGTQELDKEANSAQAVKQTTRAIFSVLNNPNFDPKGAQPALLPIANALEALGVPKETVDSKIINVPSAQELSKNYMQLVGPMVKSLGERATRAVELWQEGFPNPALQKEAQVLMTNIIDQWAQRSVDEQKAYRNWMTSDANPHRTAETFDAWFNHTNPGESYTAKAYAAAQKQYGANFKPASASHDVLIPSLAEGDPGSEDFYKLLPPGAVYRVGNKVKTKQAR